MYVFFVNETALYPVFSFDRRISSFLFALATFLVGYVMLSGKIVLPFRGIVVYIGTYAYSIYLFHKTSFFVLEKIGVLQEHATSLSGIVLWLAVFPFFIVIFAIVEATVNELIFGSREITNVYRNAIAPLKNLWPATVHHGQNI
jgi:peptidoglycan/LPS O-acetylase OafA/YrhL